MCSENVLIYGTIILHELPEFSYEIATWIYDRKVYPNSHISVEKNFYSCPYAYVGSKVDVKLTDKTLEIYFNHQRISTHLRFPAFLTNRYDTHPEDMPEAFNQPEMNDVRMCKWADKMGPFTRIVVDRIFESVQIKEQAYNSVLSVLKLSNVYSEKLLEDACNLALRKIRSPRYRHLKSILASPAFSQETPKPQKATGYADVNSIYYEERGLNKNVLLELATCQFLETATNLVFQGFTGSGKTFLACAIGKAACRHKFRVRYIRIPDIFELLAAAMISSGGYARILRRFARYHLLILDEWLANPFSDDEIRFLFELIERHYGAGSTIFCTQHPIAEWHACLGGDAIADSIMDRIVQNAIQIDTGAKNMRKHLSSHSMLDDKNLSD